MPCTVHPTQQRSNWNFTVHCESGRNVQQMNVGHLNTILLVYSHINSVRAVRTTSDSTNYSYSKITDRRTATFARDHINTVVYVYSVIP